MQARELESLFLAYRDEADVDALSQVFDRAAPELQTLARHLVREPSEAEDLLQETFLTAIERANDWQRDRRLLPWLVGILALAARRRARERARTPDPRRINSPAESAPESSASAHEFRAEVERALAALPEEERELLSQYLLDERKPHEIAGEQGLAPGTVRMRIQRALESLRRLLPAGAALGGAALLTSPRTLADVRKVVLARGRERAAASSLASAGLLAGLAALPKALLAAALVASLGLVTWLALESGSGHTPEGDPGSLAAGPALAHGESLAARIESGSAAGERSPAQEAGVVAGGDWVRIAIEEPAHLEPGSVRVLVACKGAEPSLRLEVPAAQELQIDVSSMVASQGAPRGLVVRIDHPSYLPQNLSLEFPTEEVAPGRRELRATIRLVRALSFVEGTIALDGLSPDPKGLLALVERDEAGRNLPRVVDQTQGLAAGPFKLRSAKAGPHTLVASLLGATPHSQELQLALGETRSAGRILLAKGLAIRGRVNLPLGHEGWIAEISADLKDARPSNLGDLQSLAWIGEQVVRYTASARTASDGGFELGGLSKGTYRVSFTLSVAIARGARPLAIADESPLGFGFNPTLTREVPCPSENLTVDLPASAERGFLLRVTSAGLPLGGATVDRMLREGGLVGARTDAQGELPILIATKESFRLRISKAGFRLQELELAPAAIVHGSTREVVLEAGPPVVEVVIDAGSALLADLALQLAPLEALGGQRPDPSDIASPRRDLPGFVWSAIRTDGTLYEAVPAGNYWGRVLPRNPPDNGGATNLLPSVFECQFEAGKSNRVRVTLHEGGRVRIDSRAFPTRDERIPIAIRNPAGAEVWANFWERSLNANGVPTSRATPGAIYAGTLMECDPLPAGKYSVVITRPGKPAEEHELVLEPGKSSTIVLSP